jgi:hypothetical protein
MSSKCFIEKWTYYYVVAIFGSGVTGVLAAVTVCMTGIGLF